MLDLSHESLMRGWQRLRQWVEDEAQSARIFRRLLDTARLWSDGKAGLFRDPDLQIALSWREQEAPNAAWAEQYGGDFETAIGFLETSNAETEAERQAREAARQRELEQARQLAEAQQLRLEQQQRAARRLRLMIAGLAAVAVDRGRRLRRRAVRQPAGHHAGGRGPAKRGEGQRQKQRTRAEQSQKETASALAVVASQKAKVEGSLSKAERPSARAAEEAGRKLLYTTDMRLAPFVWRDDRTTAEQLRVLLAKHIPESKAEANKDVSCRTDMKPDLRGFEWYYYQHLLEQSAAVFSGHGVSVVDGAFTSDGQLVTLDQNGQVRRWDLGSQARRRSEPPRPARRRPALESASCRPTDGWPRWPKATRFTSLTPPRAREVPDRFRQYDHHRRLIFSPDGDRLVIVDDKIRWCERRERRGDRIRRSRNSTASKVSPCLPMV